MARKRAFTPATLDGPICVPVSDPDTPGLSLRPLRSGCKRWQYRRRLPSSNVVVKLTLGSYPVYSIAQARQWASKLNEQVEAGVDPRETRRAEEARAIMTVDRAHQLYMTAVREGRSSRAKKRNKPRTIADKLAIYEHEIRPRLGRKIIYDVTETDLVRLVTGKGKVAKVRANRLAAELKVFFGWAASLRGVEVGLENDPSRRLQDLRFPETPRARKLSLQEIEWFLLALADEQWDYQRGMLAWLLTAARLAEVTEARSEELVGDVWIIPASRTKNSVEHRIALAPWGRSLMQSNDEWVFPAPKLDGPRSRDTWYKARNRVKKRMEKLAGHPIERFTPHDFRRTVRSNTKRLSIDFETAEAMLNHVKKGLERTYDRYDLEEEKRVSFLKWEMEIAEIACGTGLAGELMIPASYSQKNPALVAANDGLEAPLTAESAAAGKSQQPRPLPALRAGFTLSARFQFGSGDASH